MREQIVELLRKSSLDWCALRPTGFHSALAMFLDMARVPLFGNPEAKSNPIADEDLAEVAVEQLLTPTIIDREPACGGPDILTRPPDDRARVRRTR